MPQQVDEIKTFLQYCQRKDASCTSSRAPSLVPDRGLCSTTIKGTGAMIEFGNQGLAAD